MDRKCPIQDYKEIMRNKNISPSPAHERFLSLIEKNKGIIYKISNSYCQKIDDREDLVQEIILQLWKSFDRYDDRYKISTWMYRIALNVAISFYRTETKRNDSTQPLTENSIHFAEDLSSGELESNITLLQQFIKGLRELDKALMILYLEDKSYKEIGDILGISETNVATKINRTKEILKQKFETTKHKQKWRTRN